MPRRIDLPPELQRAAMRVADAYALGLTESRLRGNDLVRPFHGVRMSHHLPLDLFSRCAAYSTIMGAQRFFSHETAALLYGCPLPTAVEADTVLHVSAPTRSLIPKGKGVIGHLSSSPEVTPRTILLPGWSPDLSAISTVRGFPSETFRDHAPPILLRVADPYTVFLSLAGRLSRTDLVAVGDYLVRRPVHGVKEYAANGYAANGYAVTGHALKGYAVNGYDRPFTSLDELRKRVDGWSGRHARSASSALSLVREGADSRPETLLRLLLTDAGLPEPELNVDVWDATGRWIARVDLLYREFGVVVEYDGDQHRTSKQQYERDIHRIEDLMAATSAVVRVRASGLGSGGPHTLRRVMAALGAAGWNPK